MREILFRGKRENSVWWVFGDLNTIYAPNTIFIQDENGTNFSVIPETVGQFTGLTDRNGVKIFEGDIVKVDDDFDTFGKMAGEIREVWFKDGGFRLKPKYANTITRGDRGYWMEDGTDFEVIGNIYDNPELVGGGNVVER